MSKLFLTQQMLVLRTLKAAEKKRAVARGKNVPVTAFEMAGPVNSQQALFLILAILQ